MTPAPDLASEYFFSYSDSDCSHSIWNSADFDSESKFNNSDLLTQTQEIYKLRLRLRHPGVKSS